MPLASKQSQCFLSVVRITEREASKVPQVNINVLSISNCRDAMDRQQQLMRRGQYIRKISIDAPACLSCRHTDRQTGRHMGTREGKRTCSETGLSGSLRPVVFL